ncbi:TolC family outer membrane protein [Candidatus Halobeggiatoa sp. HSG11]|nr:TolC family outer membrane protein [Candidatus Halobeggiatoa sp. HSG11]
MKYLILTLLVSFNLQAETLNEVVQHTLATNPDVLVTIQNYRASKQTVKQIQGGYLPSLELYAGYGSENSDNSTTRTHFGGDTTLTRSEIGLTLSQILFDGFKTKYGVKQYKFLANSANHKVRNTSENIALLTSEVYLEMLRRHEILELTKNNVVIHQKILGQIKLLVEGGAGRKADVQQSSSRLFLAKSSLVNAKGRLRDAEINYRRVTGELPKKLEQPEAMDKNLPKNSDEALNLALNKHSSLQLAKANLAAAKASHNQSKSAFMPNVTFELGVSDKDNIDGIEGANDDMTAMLRMRYNLFRGGSDVAKVQETAELIGAAKENTISSQRIIEEDVLLSWNGLETIQARLKYLQEYVKSAEAVLNSYKEQFKLGQRSLLDVLDSENELFNARASLVSAKYTRVLSVVKLLESMGVLLDTLQIELSQEVKYKDG